MARVLLVNPRMSQRASHLPLSLLPLAGSLLAGGHEVRLLDLQVEESSDVDPRSYDLVGITSYTGSQIEGGLSFARLVRKRSPETPVVWGGVHPTLTDAQTATHPLVDIVVRGEGDATLPALIGALDHAGPLEDVEGLTFEVDGRIHRTPDAAFVDMEQVPLSPYHLLKPDRYTYVVSEGLVFIESSRGCPHNCGFCYGNTMHRRRWRAKSPERVVEEMQHAIDSLGARIICFADDNFCVSETRVEGIARRILDLGVQTDWRITSRFDYVSSCDPGLLVLLKSAGCNEIWCAGEFGSQKMLDLIDKKITPEQIRTGLRKLTDAGIPCPVGFMAGYPTETMDDSMATLDLVDEILRLFPDNRVQLSIYTPYPGTPLFPMAVSYGFKQRRSLEEWGRYKFGLVENLPWLSHPHARMLRVAGLLVRSTFLSPEYARHALVRRNPFLRAADRILYESARFRFKRRLFKWAPEWRLLDLFLKLTNSWER